MAEESPIYHTLVIDDELDICFLLKSILRRKHTSVSCANTMDGAKEELRRQKPDIIFLDNFLPDGMGLDLLIFIKRIYPEAKIIMISAHDDEVNQKLAIARGAQKFLPKPIMVDELDETIHELYD